MWTLKECEYAGNSMRSWMAVISRWWLKAKTTKRHNQLLTLQTWRAANHIISLRHVDCYFSTRGKAGSEGYVEETVN